MSAAAGATAAHAAAIANAIRASGAIVRVAPEEFLRLVGRMERPLVVTAGTGFLSPGHKYLTSYKGLAFYARSPEPLPLPGDTELVTAKSIWIPS